MEHKIKIVGIPGSLRAGSSASLILKHIADLVPHTIEFIFYEGVGNLPHFDDSEIIAPGVSQFRQLLHEADGVIICQPEYAFGVAGSLKNALDWTVGSGELTGKPVALITAATGGDKAHAAMLLILKALSSKVTKEATLLIPFIRTKFNTEGAVINSEVLQSLSSVLDALIQTIYMQKHEQNSDN